MNIPTRVAWGWSAADDSWLSRAIRYMTRPGWSFSSRAKWSHMFVLFTDGNGESVIHEALGSSGWCCKPATKLADWLNRDPIQHRACVEWLDIPPETVVEIWRDSSRRLGRQSYAWVQIAVFGMSHTIIGRAIRKMFPAFLMVDISRGAVCSENACSVVGEKSLRYDLRKDPGEPWAAISPQDAFDRYVEKVRKG